MGLDMYIYKKRDFYSDDDVKKASEIVGEEINSFSIKKQVAYWRKANMIHKWIEDNVVEREISNCEDILLEKQDFQKLMMDCTTVSNDKSLAPEIMPTKDGFFFGSIEYDDEYFYNIKRTAELCKEIIDNWDDSAYYEYHAWW